MGCVRGCRSASSGRLLEGLGEGEGAGGASHAMPISNLAWLRRRNRSRPPVSNVRLFFFSSTCKPWLHMGHTRGAGSEGSRAIMRGLYPHSWAALARLFPLSLRPYYAIR